MTSLLLLAALTGEPSVVAISSESWTSRHYQVSVSLQLIHDRISVSAGAGVRARQIQIVLEGAQARYRLVTNAGALSNLRQR